MSAIASERGGAWRGLAGMALLAAGLAVTAVVAAAPEVGRPAPALVARSFNGGTFDLSTLRGKVVVLNFWASWCGPCRSEMPLLDAVQREYRDRGVVVVGLSADDRHDRKDAVKAAAGLSYLTGLLAEAPVNGFGAPQVLPLTYIIGPTGTLGAVLSANRGPLSAAQLREALNAQLPAVAGAVAAPTRSTP